MQLQHHFEVSADIETAWAVLMDIPAIAPCLPGAELTEVVDDTHFKGEARIKIGPIALKFAGVAEIVEVDDKAHSARLLASGADTKGRGNAVSEILFHLSDSGGGKTRVDVETNVNLTGSIAQYGRASGLIDAVAKQLIADFVTNLEGVLAQYQAAQPKQAGKKKAAGKAGKKAKPKPEPKPKTKAAPPPAREPKAISGLSLLGRALWSMIKGWFRS